MVDKKDKNLEKTLASEGIELADEGISKKDFRSASEDIGIEFATKEELEEYIQKQIEKRIQQALMKDAGLAVAKAPDVEVATPQDLDIFDYVMNRSPKVTMVIPIIKTSDGQPSEHKRELILSNGEYARDKKTGNILFECYIPVSINGWDFPISLGVFDPTKTQVVVKDIPLPCAYIISENRSITFQLPDGEAYVPYTISNEYRLPLMRVTNLSFEEMFAR